jgi:nicotinamidase-related amidase
MAGNISQCQGEKLVSDVRDSPDGKIVVGPPGNFWIWSQKEGWDLTHPADPNSAPLENRVHVDCEVSNVVLDPAKTALVIIDMQNFAMSAALNADVPGAMYKAEDALVRYGIPAARALGFQVIWLNWGLSEDDLARVNPAEIRVFGFKANNAEADYGLSHREGDPNDPDNFLRCGEHLAPSRIPGAEIGKITLEDGTEVDAGRVMMQGTWNAHLHGPLARLYEEGKTTPRPDVWINKTRNSGLWKETTECSQFLEGNGIRTLLFAGVNIDQCVEASLQDAHARSIDTILVKDGCATNSPSYAQESSEYNTIRNWGFLTSCKALAKAAGMDWKKHEC